MQSDAQYALETGEYCCIDRSFLFLPNIWTVRTLGKMLRSESRAKISRHAQKRYPRGKSLRCRLNQGGDDPLLASSYNARSHSRWTTTAKSSPRFVHRRGRPWVSGRALSCGSRCWHDWNCRFSSENASEIVSEYDVVVDGSDNFATRYLSNDVCVFEKKPNVYGSVFRFEGQTTVFAPHLGGPCYRCLFPEPPAPGTVPNCAEAGVLGVLPGIIGMLQAIETIKLIVGIGEPLVGRLLHFDALRMKFRELNLRRDPQCPVCGENPTIFSPIDYEQFCGARREEKAVPTMSAHELKRKMDAREPFELIDVRETFEYEIARIDGAKLIPLREIAERADELQREGPIVIHCHSGQRSAQAVRLLQQRGFANVYNLEGGIDAWANEIDPAMQKY